MVTLIIPEPTFAVNVTFTQGVRLLQGQIDEVSQSSLFAFDLSSYLAMSLVFHLERLRTLCTRQEMPRTSGYIERYLLHIQTTSNNFRHPFFGFVAS